MTTLPERGKGSRGVVSVGTREVLGLILLRWRSGEGFLH
jgi:hypothetical protein